MSVNSMQTDSKQTVRELFANTNKDVLIEQEGWHSNNILNATVGAKGKNVSANIRGKVKMCSEGGHISGRDVAPSKEE